MAPPAIQGIAQQLILDRQVGSLRFRWLVHFKRKQKEDHKSGL